MRTASAFLALTCAGSLLLVYRERINPAWSALIAACGAALIVMGLVLCVHEATDNVPALPMWVALLVALFMAAITAAGIVYYARGASAKTVVRFVLTLTVVAIGTMLLINIVKVPWGRARMRLITLTGNDSYFSPWWKAGSELKKKLVPVGTYGVRGMCDVAGAAANAQKGRGKTHSALVSARLRLVRRDGVHAPAHGRALPD